MNITSNRPFSAAAACALLFIAVGSVVGQPGEFAGHLDPGELKLSPSKPNASFPGEGDENRLSPNTSIIIAVKIEETGIDDKGIVYQLKGEPTITGLVFGEENLWTGEPGTDTTYMLTNTAQDVTVATLTVECVWEPLTYGGGGPGSRPGDIPGFGDATVYLEDSVITWDFDREFAIYNLVDHDEEDRRIGFTLTFTDTAGRKLSSDQISNIEITFAEDIPGPLGGGLQAMGQGGGGLDAFGLVAHFTEALEAFTNHVRGFVEPEDPEEGGTGTPIAGFRDGGPSAKEEPAEQELPIARLLLLSDLNNDGDIDGSDAALLKPATSQDSTPTDRELAREYMFVNDRRSNGIHDLEDPAAPAGTQQDDDALRIRIDLSVEREGYLWFEHSKIGNLAFYEDPACENSIEFPVEIGSAGFLGGDIYVRAEGDWAGEVVEDLVLKYGKHPNVPIEDARLNLTVVKEIGDESYFMAARDYMLEHNSRVHVRYMGENEHEIRILTMRHEASTMKVIETYHRNPKLYGIDAVVHQNQGVYDVIINGNFCYFPGNRLQRAQAMRRNEMTPRCHGLLITNGVMSPAGSTGGSTPLEGPLAKYIASNEMGTIEIRQGVVPHAPVEHEEALGGLAGNLEGGTAAGYNIHPWYGIAHTGAHGAKAKVLFMVTQGNRTSRYNVEDLIQRLSDSGCPPLPENPAQIMCVAGDGGTSSAFAYRLEGGPVTVRLKGSKHQPNEAFQRQGRYWINTYLAFKSEHPR